MPEISKVVVKDESELYKYTVFCFNLISNLSDQRECFKDAVILVYLSFQALYKADADKMNYLLKYYIMETLVYQAKRGNAAKRYFLFKLLRIFCDTDSNKAKLLDLLIETTKDTELLYHGISVLTEKDGPRTEKSKS